MMNFSIKGLAIVDGGMSQNIIGVRAGAVLFTCEEYGMGAYYHADGKRVDLGPPPSLDADIAIDATTGCPTWVAGPSPGASTAPTDEEDLKAELEDMHRQWRAREAI